MIQNNTLVKYSLAPTEIYRQNADSILYLETQSGIGSGVIVNKDGTFITCYHAIADADFITVKAGDGQKYTVNGFKYINPLYDVAILTIDNKNSTFKPIKY